MKNTFSYSFKIKTNTLTFRIHRFRFDVMGLLMEEQGLLLHISTSEVTLDMYHCPGQFFLNRNMKIFETEFF